MHCNNIISSEHFHWSCTGNCWKSSYQHLNEYTGYLWMLIFWVVFEVFESSIMHYKSLFHYYLVYCTSQVFLSRYMFLKLFQVFYMCNLILSLFTAKVTDFLMSFSMCKFEMWVFVYIRIAWKLFFWVFQLNWLSVSDINFLSF